MIIVWASPSVSCSRFAAVPSGQAPPACPAEIPTGLAIQLGNPTEKVGTRLPIGRPFHILLAVKEFSA